MDALRGHHLWAARFDRPTRDIFAIQDEIAKRVIVELQVELTEGVQAQIASRGTNNLDAWLLRVQALNELWKWTREGHVRARELYKAANEADPNWARPVTGLAIISWWEAKQGWTNTPKESIRVGMALAEQAISLNPDDIGGYQVLANLYFLTSEPERAIALRRKAIELAPNDAVNLAGTVVRFNEYGLQEEAVELLERAIRLNPVAPWWFYSGYGLALHLVGRKEEAAQWLEKSVAARQRADTYARLAAVYVDLNRMDDAKGAAEQALRRNPRLTVMKYQNANSLKDPRQIAWYRDLLVRSGIPE